MSSPLSPVDASFWTLETETTRQSIAALCILDSIPDRKQIEEQIISVSHRFPRLLQKVVNHPPLCWEQDRHFSVANHLRFVVHTEIANRQSLLDVAAEEFSIPLSKSSPPWRIVVISNQGDGNCTTDLQACLLFIIHHSFADGLGGLTVFDSFCSNSPQPTKSVVKPLPESPPEARSLHIKESLLHLLREAFSPSPRSPVNGKNSTKRGIHLVDFPLQSFLQKKRELKVSLNDLLLAAVSGAARRYHLYHGQAADDLRVIMPVNLRRHSQRYVMGNFISGVGVKLPISQSTAKAQVASINKHIKNIRTEGAVGAYAIIARLNSYLPTSLARWLSEFAARKTNFICTNVTAARSFRYVGGAKILSEYGVPATMRSHGLGFAFSRYAEKICICLVHDPEIVSDPDRVVTFLSEAVREIMELR